MKEKPKQMLECKLCVQLSYHGRRRTAIVKRFMGILQMVIIDEVDDQTQDALGEKQTGSSCATDIMSFQHQLEIKNAIWNW